MGIKHKTCDKHQVNSVNHPDKFHLQFRKTGKYHFYICKQCRYEKRRQYYLNNKERERELMKQWREKNPERWKFLCRGWHITKSERYLNDEDYRNLIKSKRNNRIREWKQKNRKKYRLLRNRYQKKRMERDPAYKIQERLRSRVSILMRKINTVKTDSTLKMLGCSREELKIYIEKKFEDGMNWDNYGTWHVDHIIPCSRFNLSDPEQQKICFHYTNLQPMWGEHNMKKGGRLC